MSIEDVFDEFNEEKKEDKTVPEETPKLSEESETEVASIPEEGEEPKEKEDSEKAPAEEPVAAAVDDWFAPAVEEPTKDKLAEDQPIENIEN